MTWLLIVWSITTNAGTYVPTAALIFESEHQCQIYSAAINKNFVKQYITECVKSAMASGS
jgi:hypothetical protein